MLAEDVRRVEIDNQRLQAENEELRRLLGEEPPKPMDCGSCKNFMEHYIRTSTGYFRVNDGHCMATVRVSGRKTADGKTCRYFELGKRRLD